MVPISKEEFEKMYVKFTNVEMSKKLQVSVITIGNWAKKLGLPSKRKSLIK